MKTLRHILYDVFKKLLKQSKLKAFFAGTMVGLILSWSYILLGGDVFWGIPTWAYTIFYPGFWAGFVCYDFFNSAPVATLIGTICVGMFYGVAFLAILSIWKLCAQKKQYLIAILCILTLVLGIAFSILLFWLMIVPFFT